MCSKASSTFKSEGQITGHFHFSTHSYSVYLVTSNIYLRKFSFAKDSAEAKSNFYNNAVRKEHPFRSSHRSCSVKKTVLKVFAIFAGKYRSLVDTFMTF